MTHHDFTLARRALFDGLAEPVILPDQDVAALTALCARKHPTVCDFAVACDEAGIDVVASFSGYYWRSGRLAPERHGPFATLGECARDAAAANGLVLTRKHIYPHLVTPWLASRLKERGEVVDFLAGVGFVWARTSDDPEFWNDCPVQAIYLERKQS